MILNFEGQHSRDVIIITSLRLSGVDTKTYVADDYKHLLSGLGLDYFRVKPVKLESESRERLVWCNKVA
jgi:hypothetical protein